MNQPIRTAIATIALVFISAVAVFAQRTFTFQIDDHKYELEETKYNDLFGAAFSKIAARGVAKEKNFELWAQTFGTFKDISVQGYYIYTTYGERLSNSQFSGEMPLAYLGWETLGKLSKANPNKQNSVAARMAVINHYLSREVIYYFTHKEIIN